ncbi:MAG: hypothetical protein IGR93_19315 [Hydrococcus sp. C42_A2020_068]|jgi:hypothetical protein|uniref:hypothetical protein n=1 Tax=Pleurocapsa sp. PCC 7327 TaxID=118163 RepID=UPI00029F9B20|nr:hypothetical protein [Pleurocapsa sp. PCC 7327]AFY78369.1 hypothetical protein Ple7327_3140 [Pleurocapsa sp. PCC 7327]MBF2022179.1 hypothetical protein [Hydrococcus sp. C42_A2020_068]
MSKVDKQLPLAPLNCERLAIQMFPLGMSPEEYAARYAADWYCFSFNRYCYRDPELNRWIQRLGEIFSTPALLAQCQEEMLTSEELVKVRQRLVENFYKEI